MLRPATASMSVSNTRRPRRSTVACKNCNARKVRCIVALSGTPCVNCTVDGVPCEVSGRRRRRNPDFLQSVSHEDRDSNPAEISQNVQPRQRAAAEAAEGVGQGSHLRSTTIPELPAQGNQSSSKSMHPSTFLADTCPDPSDATEDRAAYAEALEAQNGQEEGGVPFYPGDNRGLAFIMEVCEPDWSSRTSHFMVPMPSIKSLDPEDLNYLRAKGAFSLPHADIREALIQCYFHHVHPLAPILDTLEFIAEYEKGRTSLLLLWSMFLAAASFIDDIYLTEDFFATKKSLKQAMYKRAKALYDADYEKDKAALIQSVFLLSHWFTNTEDRTGPWFWNGIAITLSHTVGLHRLSNNNSRQVEPMKRPFWRRLWWSIYCREAWLSQALGRPMRTRLDEADTAMPTLSDIDDQGSCQPLGSWPDSSRYLSKDLGNLLRVWLDFVRLSASLGKILVMNYRSNGRRPSPYDLERSEAEIRACYCNELDSSDAVDQVVQSQAHQLRLYFEAVIIVLYRPWILDTPASVATSEESTWRSMACRKARTAASNAVAPINALMAEDTMGLCHSISLLALLPVMQIHLFELTSSRPRVREVGKHNLGLCMIAMDELRKVYLAADAAYKLFDAAINKINNQSRHTSHGESKLETTRIEESFARGAETWAEAQEMGPSGIIPDPETPFPISFGFPTSFGVDLSNSDTLDNNWMDIFSLER